MVTAPSAASGRSSGALVTLAPGRPGDKRWRRRVGQRFHEHGLAARFGVQGGLQHRGRRRNAVGDPVGRDAASGAVVRRLLVKLGFAALLRLPFPPLGLGPLGEQGARRLPWTPGDDKRLGLRSRIAPGR
jgi:hypothetical protein